MTESVGAPIPWDEEVLLAPPPNPGLFRFRGYPLFWFVSAIIGAGYGITLGSQSSFWDAATYDSRTIAFIGLANGLGIMAGYLLAGLTADQRSKKLLILVATLMMASVAAATTVLAMIVELGGNTFFAIAALLSVPYGVAVAVMLGWLGDLLPRRLLAKGIVILSFAEFPLGTLLILPSALVRNEQGAVPGLFAVGGFLFLLAALLSRRIPIGNRPADPSATALAGLKGAIRYAWRDSRLKAVWLYIFVASVLLVLLEGPLTRVVFFDSGLERLEYAIALGARGLAGVVATIALVFLISGRRKWSLFVVAAATIGVTTLGLVFASTPPVLIAVMIPHGAAIAVVFLAYKALALLSTPAGYFGRMAAFLLFANYSLNFAAGLLSGFLYDLVGGRWAILVIGACLLIAAGWFYRRWLRFRDLPEDPDAAMSGPVPMLFADMAAPQKPSEPI